MAQIAVAQKPHSKLPKWCYRFWEPAQGGVFDNCAGNPLSGCGGVHHGRAFSSVAESRDAELESWIYEQDKVDASSKHERASDTAIADSVLRDDIELTDDDDPEMVAEKLRRIKHGEHVEDIVTGQCGTLGCGLQSDPSKIPYEFHPPTDVDGDMQTIDSVSITKLDSDIASNVVGDIVESVDKKNPRWVMATPTQGVREGLTEKITTSEGVLETQFDNKFHIHVLFIIMIILIAIVLSHYANQITSTEATIEPR